MSTIKIKASAKMDTSPKSVSVQIKKANIILPVKKTIAKVTKVPISAKSVSVQIGKAKEKSTKTKMVSKKTVITSTPKNTTIEEASENISSELWKVIPGYKKYCASNLGRILTNNNKRPHKGTKNPEGYITYSIINDNGKRVTKLGHQLIATTWLPNENKPTIDHINRKRDDNRAINLRYATYKEQSQNIDYANRKNSRGVWKCDLETNEKIKFYKTIKEALVDVNKAENATSNISKCALGKQKSAYGFKWIYEDNIDLENEEWKLYLSVKTNNYYVSNHGRVKNDNKMLKTSKKNGYNKVTINKKTISVHRLIATLFVENPNPTKYNIVNHKDACKENNNSANLEWTNAKGNATHAVQNNLNKLQKKIIHFDDNHNIIGIYVSCREAARDLKIDRSVVSGCCKGTRKISNDTKLKFKYLDDTDDIENMKIKPPQPKVINKLKSKKGIQIREIEVYRDGKLIEICKTMTQAAQKYKVHRKTVENHCLNKTKYPDIKCTFKYAN